MRALHVVFASFTFFVFCAFPFAAPDAGQSTLDLRDRYCQWIRWL